MTPWISRLFTDPAMLKMGHGQASDDLNLGLGWLYYGFARAMRPNTVVVIGSYRGFVPLVFGRALHDNQSDGKVVFIDPSMVDDHWSDAESVKSHFAKHETFNISHIKATTQEFVLSRDYAEIKSVDILFVDGYHSEDQSMFDFESFLPKMALGALVLFHDSCRPRDTEIYGAAKKYTHTVYKTIDRIRAMPDYQVFSIPLYDGVTLVSRKQ